MKTIFTLCNYIAANTPKKILAITSILLICFFQSQTIMAQCTPPTLPNFCTPPATFNYTTVSNGNWTSASTWLGGNVPPTEDIDNKRIKITHDVTVQNNNIKLKNASVIYISDGGRLTLRNGDFKIEGGNQNTYEALIIIRGALRTSGNCEQNGPSTVLYANNAMMEIGDELATATPAAFTSGLFNSSTSSTSANFKNKKGYRRLENVCINVTENWETEGNDIYINVCGEVGDRGAISGPHNINGGFDGDDDGNMKIEGKANAETKIYNSEFYIANGNFQNKRNLTLCNSDFRLTNGDFENKSSAEIEGNNITIWINHPSNGNITNNGDWSWNSVSNWRTDNSNVPSGLSGTCPPESSQSTIALKFGNCFCPQGGPLPISRLDLTAVLSNGMVSVDWATYDEVNTHYFQLERSSDGSNFTIVAEKQASGNTSGKTIYKYLDNVQSLLSQPFIYYRIKTIDKNGSLYYSSIVSVKVGKMSNVNSWPNPVADKINFQLHSENSGMITIQLYNGTGMRIVSKQVNIQRGNNALYLDKLESLTPGIYIVDMQMNGERIYLNKIIKK